MLDFDNKEIRNVKGLEITTDSTNPSFVTSLRKTHQINDNSVLINLILKHQLGVDATYVNTLYLEV